MSTPGENSALWSTCPPTTHPSTQGGRGSHLIQGAVFLRLVPAVAWEWPSSAGPC